MISVSRERALMILPGIGRTSEMAAASGLETKVSLGELA